MSFTNHSQSKSIRAVSKIGKFVASGSADESINLINMSARVEHGSLQEQSGLFRFLLNVNTCTNILVITSNKCGK